MTFVLAATPCEKCGTYASGTFDYKGGTSSRGGHEGILIRACPKCGTMCELHFHEKTMVIDVTPEPYQLGGPEPSTVFDPGQFMAEFDRVSQLVPANPPPDPEPGIAAIERALTSLVEIGKFIPKGADEVPASAFWTEAGKHDRKLRPTRYRRSWLDAEHEKFLAAEDRYFDAAAARSAPAAAPAAPSGTLDKAALQAHLEWVGRGGSGGGRLSLCGLRAPSLRLGAAELSGAILTDCVLDGAGLSYGTLAQAQLERVSFAGAGLASTSFAGSRLVGCHFDGAGMVHAKLGDAKLDGCTFAEAELDRSTWYRTEVRKSDFRAARFGNAALDQAVFVDCDLHGATLALHAPQPLGSTFRTRFERCDLRDTTWGGRNLDDACFVHCRFDGAGGKPAAAKRVAIERAEIGDRRLDGDAALAALGWK